MGACTCVSAPPESYNVNTADSNFSLSKIATMSSKKSKDTDFTFTHTKHYERYFNRQFKVSTCTAKGERKTMEDSHLCQFLFSKHPQYSLFALFDGHDGHAAAFYLADNLYKTLNNLPDLNDNEMIIKAIKILDKEYIGPSGSTLIFVLATSHAKNVDTSINNIDNDLTSDVSPATGSSTSTPIKRTVSQKLLTGINLEHKCRVFWLGDSRAYLVDSEFESFEALTIDHNVFMKEEVNRLKKAGGKIINGRVSGHLLLTRSFGDAQLKRDKSCGVLGECEYKEFTAKPGDLLLLSCDGLTEKWSDNTLKDKLHIMWAEADRKKSNENDDVDIAKVMGNFLVDDAIYEGSNDNISVMLIQFKKGRKKGQESIYKKYQCV